MLEVLNKKLREKKDDSSSDSEDSDGEKRKRKPTDSSSELKEEPCKRCVPYLRVIGEQLSRQETEIIAMHRYRLEAGQSSNKILEEVRGTQREVTAFKAKLTQLAGDYETVKQEAREAKNCAEKTDRLTLATLANSKYSVPIQPPAQQSSLAQPPPGLPATSPSPAIATTAAQA